MPRGAQNSFRRSLILPALGIYYHSASRLTPETVLPLGEPSHSGAQSCHLARHIAPEQGSRPVHACHSTSQLTPEPSLVTRLVNSLLRPTRGSARRVTRPVASLLSKSRHSTSRLTPEPSLVTRRGISLRNKTRGTAGRVTLPVASLLSQSFHSASHLTPEPSLASSRLPRYPPVPPPPPPLPSPLPPHLTARSPLRARRIFHGIPAFFNGGEGKNVRLRMKDQPRVGRDEKSSSGLLRSFRKPSFVPRIGNIEQTGRRGPTFLYFFLLFLFLGNCQFNCLLRPGRSTKRLISMCIVSDV